MNRFRLNVNGRARDVEADASTPLLDVLRGPLDLTGTKYGCGEGVCGTCTILLDGSPVRSCVTPVSAVKNKPIVTIEGLATHDHLHPVQEAFLEVSAFQCGYCTPGMILEAVGLLKSHPQPTDEDIRQGMDGHICRCGTYPRIVEAVRLAARGGHRA